jgi:lauroyl/myristoyl acyltransferase
VPGWRRRVGRAMKAALGPDAGSDACVGAYFRRLADSVAFSQAVFRSGVGTPLLRREWVHDAASGERLLAALAGGKGVILAAPHLIGTEVMLATAAREVPIAVLARKAPDPEYEALKQQWYRALGVQVVHRPRRGEPFAAVTEMTAALRLLRKNQVLAITPDLPQKPGSGVPVRLLGRTVELPAGPFFLAARTGAPLLPAFFHWEDGRYLLWAHEALRVEAGEERDAGLAEAAQQWAGMFEAFLRDHPEMWQFWLDKRWEEWLSHAPV